MSRRRYGLKRLPKRVSISFNLFQRQLPIAAATQSLHSPCSPHWHSTMNSASAAACCSWRHAATILPCIFAAAYSGFLWWHSTTLRPPKVTDAFSEQRQPPQQPGGADPNVADVPFCCIACGELAPHSMIIKSNTVHLCDAHMIRYTLMRAGCYPDLPMLPDRSSDLNDPLYYWAPHYFPPSVRIVDSIRANIVDDLHARLLCSRRNM